MQVLCVCVVYSAIGNIFMFCFYLVYIAFKYFGTIALYLLSDNIGPYRPDPLN